MAIESDDVAGGDVRPWRRRDRSATIDDDGSGRRRSGESQMMNIESLRRRKASTAPDDTIRAVDVLCRPR